MNTLASLTLDPRTLGLMSILLAGPLSIILALTHSKSIYTGGIGPWATGKFCFALGFGLNMLRGVAPAWMTDLLSPILGCTGMALLAVGVLSYKRKRVVWPVFAGYLILAAALAIANFFISSANTVIRLALGSLIFLPAFYAAKLLLVTHVHRSLRTPYWITGSMFFILGCSMFTRNMLGSGFSANGAPHDGWLNQISLGILCLSFLVLSYSFLTMLHSRIAIDLERLASVDALTGAMNRRSLGEQAAKLAKRRGTNVVGIIMLDIDHFKAINDQYGHQAGDKVLQHLAASAQSVLRGVDHFARVGGEEFCALLTDSDETMTALVAERIREACAKSRVTYRGQKIKYSVSAGASSGDTATNSFEKLIGEADQALYLAKNTGRNRVIRFTQMQEMVDTETFAKSQIQEQHYSFTASNFRSPDDPQY